jgi:hypothetical protein
MRAKTKAVVALLVAFLIAGGFGPLASGGDGAPAVVRFRQGRFEPRELLVKARCPLKVRVVNANRDAIEFESFELNRERVVQPGQEITVHLPPLEPGTYKFFDDFHHDAGQGSIEAR